MTFKKYLENMMGEGIAFSVNEAYSIFKITIFNRGNGNNTRVIKDVQDDYIVVGDVQGSNQSILIVQISQIRIIKVN